MSISTTTQDVLREIAKERAMQEEKWGEQNHKPIEWMAILMEEVGEVSREALEHHFQSRFKKWIKPDPERLQRYRKELIQVAAVAVSMIESLDRMK